MDKSLIRVTFQPMNRWVDVPKGTPLPVAIRLAGIPIESICGGKGLCRKCRVILVQGTCRTEIPEGSHVLPEEEREKGHYLACQVVVTGECEFTIPVESRIDSPKILISSSLKIKEISPVVARFPVEVTPPGDGPASHRSIRLKGYTGRRPEMSEEIHRQILTAREPLLATLLTADDPPKVLFTEPETVSRTRYGLALDLGTTTVVGCLTDLSTGEIVTTGSTLNRQITYGEEVLTRIGYAKTPGGLSVLQKSAAESINAVISAIRQEGKIGRDDIVCMTVGGNTVMNHLLCGIDPGYLEMANAEVSRSPIIQKASGLELGIHPDAPVYCLPNVSRFIGGDAIGDVIVSGILRSKETALIVDLGTNGEIILGNEDWLASVSCASGPAFEGAGITAGMRGMKGAIDHIAISPSDGDVTFSVIGDVPPRGICGSGIIDIASEMVNAGILDFAGKLVASHQKVRSGPEGSEYVFLDEGKTATGHDLVITQRDIDYLVDSKAAACGGIAVLLKKYKVSPAEIRHVYLAGAFGAYTDIKSAINFGIIPEFEHAEYHPMGNGSLSGAYAALMSRACREEADRAASMMVYIDLLVDTDFIEEYSAALYIPGKPYLFPSSAGRSH
ncbi:MAG TPA: ASKHA domain-containing protein [Methanoregulaceae archaeon]|nr:ASKHA domain-containing protein [Methanoregulaceae archaeon]